MSREVAMGFSKQGRQGSCSMVFEIRMGMVDRGASVGFLSQFPIEEEILFAPLTGVPSQFANLHFFRP